MGRIFRSLVVLEKGHAVECDRSRLVAEYIGQTATRTADLIDEALESNGLKADPALLEKVRAFFDESATAERCPPKDLARFVQDFRNKRLT